MLLAPTPTEKNKMKMITIWLWLVVCGLPWHAHALELMLPQVYAEDIDVANWLVSEKLDGVRGYWDGNKLRSKTGCALHQGAQP